MQQRQRETSEPTIDDIATRVEHLLTTARQRYQRLWAYYRNPMRVVGVASGRESSLADRPYRQAQEWGLPPRITGCRSGCEVGASQPIDDVSRKQVVIENDIGWRIETMIDLRVVCGKPKRRPKRPKPSTGNFIPATRRTIPLKPTGVSGSKTRNVTD